MAPCIAADKSLEPVEELTLKCSKWIVGRPRVFALEQMMVLIQGI